MPPRIHLPQVLELAGYGRVTLWRRQRAGKMPKAIDRGPFGGIFDRDAVLKALGMAQDATPDPADVWKSDPDAYRAVVAADKAGKKLQRHRSLKPSI